MRIHVLSVLLLLFTQIVSPAVLSAQSNDGVQSMIIFKYYSIGDQSTAKYSYLSDTVPDIIKETLLDKNLFHIIEKTQINRTVKEIGMDEDYYKKEDDRIKIARFLSSEYFLWGYYVLEDDKLFLFHHIVETETGRTLNVIKEEHTTGKELFDTVEKSARDFSNWINRELPQRKPESKEFSEGEKTAYSIGAGIFYNIYFPYIFSSSLKSGLGVSIDFKLYPPAIKPFYIGFLFPVAMLKALESSSVEIDLLFVPLFMKTGVNFSPLHFLKMETSINFGGAIIFGYKSPEILSYIRPSIGGEFNLLFTLVDFFTISAGIRYTCVLSAYNKWAMHLLNPQILVYLLF